MSEKIAVPESAVAGDEFEIRLLGDSWDSDVSTGSASVSRGKTVAAKLTDAAERDEFEILGEVAPNDDPFMAYLESSGEKYWLCDIVSIPSVTAAEPNRPPAAKAPGELKAPAEVVEPELDFDPVNSPPYYQSGTGLEVIDVIEAFGIDRKSGHLQNIVKYALRAGEKRDIQQDVDQLVWYALRLQERVRANGGKW